MENVEIDIESYELALGDHGAGSPWVRLARWLVAATSGPWRLTPQVLVITV